MLKTCCAGSSGYETPGHETQCLTLPPVHATAVTGSASHSSSSGILIINSASNVIGGRCHPLYHWQGSSVLYKIMAMLR
jgi:hypothetical protein